MAQYIDKDALVAEIERKQEEVSYCENGSFASWADENYYFTLETIKSLIDTLDTLEVKEVDFQIYVGEELENFLSRHKVYDDLDIAKHFFELGMAVSSEAQKG